MGCAAPPPGLVGGVVDGGDFAGGPVDGVDAAGQAHRVGAVTGRLKLGFPAGKVLAGDELEQLVGRCPRWRAGSKAEGSGWDRHRTTATGDAGAARLPRGGSSPSADKPRSPFMRAGLVRVTAAMKGAQDATDTGTGARARSRRRSACFRSRRPCLPGKSDCRRHQWASARRPRQTAPDKIFRNGRDGPRFEDTSPAHLQNLTRMFRRPSRAAGRRSGCDSAGRQRSAGDPKSRSR